MTDLMVVEDRSIVLAEWLDRFGAVPIVRKGSINFEGFSVAHFCLVNASWLDGKEYAQIDFCLIVTDRQAILIRTVLNNKRVGDLALLHPNGNSYLTESGEYEEWNTLFKRAKQNLQNII